MGVKQKHAAQTAREDRITVNLKTTRGSTFTQTLCRLLTYSSRYSLDRQKCHIFRAFVRSENPDVPVVIRLA